ncbi:MAG TPA: sulfite exporter TauE/SafE family protein [Usitatibacter sp.]|nr:sulfite exporter TauE/SafE family protein [Usitatibacter sp.]
MAELGAYLGIGAVVGFFAGLLGIGGGIIIVSALALMFAAYGFAPQYVMHLAIGTSLAAIVLGSFSSARAHHRHGAVDWDVVRAMIPGLLAGVFIGAVAARFLPGTFLKYWFLGFTLFVTAQMVFGGLRPKPSRQLPGRAGLGALAVFIGICSSLFGGGAAAVGVPFLTWCNLSAHRAIGTVSAMGFPLSIAGTLGYAIAGWGLEGLPRWSLGFVYLPAFIGISATSMLLAPVGARLAHRLKGATLRRIFAVFLLVMAAKLAVSI